MREFWQSWQLFSGKSCPCPRHFGLHVKNHLKILGLHLLPSGYALPPHRHRPQFPSFTPPFPFPPCVPFSSVSGVRPGCSCTTMGPVQSLYSGQTFCVGLISCLFAFVRSLGFEFPDVVGVARYFRAVKQKLFNC
eukprot:scaffold279328_cov26-Tisochrysis_lutea.AAC.1